PPYVAVALVIAGVLQFWHLTGTKPWARIRAAPFIIPLPRHNTVRTLAFRAPARLAAVGVLATSLLAPFGPAALAASDPYASTSAGYDVSFPDCSKVIGPTATNGKAYAFAVVGVTGGRPFTNNGCLMSEFQAVGAKGLQPSLYMNTAAPVGPDAKKYENMG